MEEHRVNQHPQHHRNEFVVKANNEESVPLHREEYSSHRSVTTAADALGVDADSFRENLNPDNIIVEEMIEDHNETEEIFDSKELDELVHSLEREHQLEQQQVGKIKRDKKKVDLNKLYDHANSVGWYKNWIVDWEDPDDVVTQNVEKGMLDIRLEDEPNEQVKKDKWWANAARRRFGDVWQIVDTYCDGWEDSKMDIATFFFLLAVFHKPPKEKKDAVFDKKLILSGYHWAQFAFAAYAGSKEGVLKELPFLNSADFIKGNWTLEQLQSAPAFYCAVDHDQQCIVLGLRGTKVKQDVLIDLAAQYVRWKGGYVHRGFIMALQKLEPQVRPIVETLKSKYTDYKVRITGHSLGAAISSLLVLKWADDFPDWDIYGYGYATPCCISTHLIEKSEMLFTTYVHNFDAVARLSMGSLQDLHNGIRLFTHAVGNGHNIVAILQGLRKITLRKNSQKVIAVAGEINKIIEENLQKELSEGKEVNHLFPAGKTFQLWREMRGKNFTTWDMYRTHGHYYGRLNFSPTMLKDHGHLGYNAAFENLLSLSVTEKKIWLGLKTSKREQLRSYWESFDSGKDPFDEDYDFTRFFGDMNRNSRYRQKAMDAGLIRPFVLLVSMAPRRRAAMAHLTGIDIYSQKWYLAFDPHREAWKILSKHRKGVQSRGTSTVRKTVPFVHSSNWYMILYACTKAVRKQQGKFLHETAQQMVKGKKKGFDDTIQACKDSGCSTVPSFEENVMMMFFDLVECQDPVLMGTDPVYAEEELEVIEKLKKLGFQNEYLLHIVAKQQVNQSGTKKANEMYAWGDVIRHDSDRVKKRYVAGMAGLTVLAGSMLFASVPALAFAPPLAVFPILASLGIGSYIFLHNTSGGLVAIVVGCLQQRLALAYHGLSVEEFY